MCGKPCRIYESESASRLGMLHYSDFPIIYRLPACQRLMVGICGVPGSGKTNLAVRLVAGINAAQPDTAVCVSMDGWHHTRATLKTFPNAKEAFDRRGAEWTFDAARFADFVTSVKSHPTQTLRAPSFDHAVKDPVEDDICVKPHHRVVVFEGLYCNCNVGDWKRAAQQFDTRLAFQIDLQDAKQRLVVRHVATGVAKDEEEAIWRGKLLLPATP